ncbi:MAG: hypothetical protein R3E39_26230 [Anaerolineae bacterium]
MGAPQTLTRPLAERVAGLPEVVEHTDSPAIPQAVIDAAVQALADGKTHYTDRPGILGLRKWVTEYLQQRFNVALTPNDVTITCGATEARFVTIKRLVKAGEKILCPGDAITIAGAAHLVGTMIVRQANDPAGIRLLYITPHDSFDMLHPFLELATQYGWWIAYDLADAPSDLTFHPAQNLALASKVVSMGSLSHIMPGWRVGWMAGSEMADKLRAYKQSMTICTTSVSQWAGMGVVDK